MTPQVNRQINHAAGIWQEYLGDLLIGVYLHGSIALGSFIEGSSDIDLLIVSKRRILRDERLSIAKKIIEADRDPSPLEMSAICADDLKPWKHPARCQFHYSGAWTEKYRQMLGGFIKEHFIIDTDFPDPDIACHVSLVNQCGIRVCGQPVKDVFPEVPEADFWSSLTYDMDEAGIITLGRVLSYKHEKKILSKYESAVWALDHIPVKYKYIFDNKIRSRFFNETDAGYNQDDVNELRKFLIDEIRA